MKNTNIREIKLKVTFAGNGIVQTDGNHQKYLYNKSANVGDFPKGALQNDNILLGKANYYKNTQTEESERKPYLRKLKISGGGLRHAIHHDNMPFHSTHIFENPEIRRSIVATPDYLLRGYMYAGSKENVFAPETIKRKSPYIITDAEQVSDGISSIEIRTQSGMRNNTAEGSSSTSFFMEESIGEITYESVGSIHVGELGFISTSYVADRNSIVQEDIPFVKNALVERFGEDQVENAYWYKNGAIDRLAERGIRLGDVAVSKLITVLLNKIAQVEITKASAYCKTLKIEICNVTDPLESDLEWVTIYDANSPAPIEYSATFHPFYIKADIDVIIAHDAKMKEIESLMKKASKERSDKKKNKNSIDSENPSDESD